MRDQYQDEEEEEEVNELLSWPIELLIITVLDMRIYDLHPIK